MWDWGVELDEDPGCLEQGKFRVGKESRKNEGVVGAMSGKS